MNFIKVKTKIIVLLIVALFIECNTRREEEQLPNEPIKYLSPTPDYKRDSLYIATTIWQFIDKEVDIFNYYKQYKIPLDKVHINVDTIIYSPDSLKLFAFVIEKIPDIENNLPKEYFYSGSGMIGFRQSIHEPWSIYRFDQFSPSGFKNYNKVRKLFRKYYLGNGDFKNASAYYWDGIHNDTLGMIRGEYRITIPFKYNVDNPLFWDSCIVWKKGSRIPGYYAFQTTGNVAPGYDDPIINIPSLDYPDSLLKMYR